MTPYSGHRACLRQALDKKVSLLSAQDATLSPQSQDMTWQKGHIVLKKAGLLELVSVSLHLLLLPNPVVTVRRVVGDADELSEERGASVNGSVHDSAV